MNRFVSEMVKVIDNWEISLAAGYNWAEASKSDLCVLPVKLAINLGVYAVTAI